MVARRSLFSIGLAVLAVLLALLCGAGALARSGARPHAAARLPCPPRGARPIAGNGVVRVYSSGGSQALRANTEACLVRRGTRMTLVPAGRGLPRILRLGKVALAGTVVAYLEGQFGVDSGCWAIVVVDVAARRVLQRLGAVACSVDAGFVRSERITGLLVQRDGLVAWMVERGIRGSATTLRVYGARPGRAPSLLDEGSDIGATSLGLSAGTVSWRRAGVERAARPAP